MRNKSETELRKICDYLIDHGWSEGAIETSLDDLRGLHQLLVERRGDQVPATSIVNLGKEAMVQFSEISPQRFLVDSPVDLTDKDFDFVTKKIWHGQRIRPKTFLSFLWSEAKLNSWKLLAFSSSLQSSFHRQG